MTSIQSKLGHWTARYSLSKDGALSVQNRRGGEHVLRHYLNREASKQSENESITFKELELAEPPGENSCGLRGHRGTASEARAGRNRRRGKLARRWSVPSPTALTATRIVLTNNITVSAEVAISAKGLTIQGNNYSGLRAGHRAERFRSHQRRRQRPLRLCLYVHHTDAKREWAYDRNSPVGRFDKALDEEPGQRLDGREHERGLEGRLCGR